jgi:hypothetical protein
MLAASRALVLEGRLPRFRTDQLSALLDAADLARRKAEAAAAAAAAAVPDLGTCVLCGSSGWVSVLDHRVMSGKVRRAQTSSVLCSCALGRYKLKTIHWKNSKGKDDTPMTLEHYARMYPDWKECLDAARQLLQKEHAAVRSARARDKKDGGAKSGKHTRNGR